MQLSKHCPIFLGYLNRTCNVRVYVVSPNNGLTDPRSDPSDKVSDFISGETLIQRA